MLRDIVVNDLGRMSLPEMIAFFLFLSVEHEMKQRNRLTKGKNQIEVKKRGKHSFADK